MYPLGVSKFRVQSRTGGPKEEGDCRSGASGWLQDMMQGEPNDKRVRASARALSDEGTYND